MLQHLAVVSDFWPRAAGLLGGARLTIAGDGFPAAAAAAVVDAGGAPCAVVSSSPSRIVCELGPYRFPLLGMVFVGSAGSGMEGETGG